MRRRTYLATAAATLSVAGCAGSDSENTETPTKDTVSVATTTVSSRTKQRPRTEPERTPTETSQEPTPTETSQEPTQTESMEESTSPEPPSQAPLKLEYDVDEVKQNAEVVDYDTLRNSIEEYREDPIYYEFAEVYRFIPSEGYNIMQMNVSTTSRDWQGDITTYWLDDQSFVENDFMQIWGFVRGLYEYETVQGNTRLVPSVQVVAHDLYESDS